MEGMRAKRVTQGVKGLKGFKELADRAGMCSAAALLDPQENWANVPTPLSNLPSSSSSNPPLNSANQPRAAAPGVCLGDQGGQAWYLPKRQLWECVCSGPSVGGQSLLECLLRASWQTGAYHALVDTTTGLDPETLYEGLEENLLWIPVRGADQTVRALDLLLRDDNFALVAADLRGLSSSEVQRIQPFAWYRLQRLAHQRAGGAVILSNAPLVRCADRRILLQHSRSLHDLDQSRDTLLQQIEATTRSYARSQMPTETNAQKNALAS